MPIEGVLTDIEGTTTPTAFVKDALFPYARARLAAFAAGAPELDAVRRLAPGQDPLAALLGWMDADAKITPLKSIQGRLWREGYESGELQGALYPDVAPSLRAWHEAGLALGVYSSGSIDAQKLLFGHSVAGDLTPLLAHHFDTTSGSKRDPASYQAIARALDVEPPNWLFLSDAEAELDAAAQIGWSTCQLVRGQDGTIASRRHPGAAEFFRVATLFGLPQPVETHP